MGESYDSLTVRDFLPKAPNIIFRPMSHWREFEQLRPHMKTNPGRKGSVVLNYCETAFYSISSNSVRALCFGETVGKCNVLMGHYISNVLTVFKKMVDFVLFIYICDEIDGMMRFGTTLSIMP